MLSITITRTYIEGSNLTGAAWIKFTYGLESILITANSLESVTRCIPTGTYELKCTYSPKFKKELLLIDNVPGRTGIRIHPFNYGSESQGCVTIGIRRKDFVTCTTETCEFLKALFKRDPRGTIQIKEDYVHTTTQDN